MVGLLLWKEERGEKRARAVQVREQSILHLRFQTAGILRTARTPEPVLRRIKENFVCVRIDPAERKCLKIEIQESRNGKTNR